MDVTDFTKEQKDLYLPKVEPIIMDVPEMPFLMIDGRGAPDPDTGSDKDISEFEHAVGALYGLAYSIKMSDKKGAAPKGWHNFKVPPLEGLWWMADNQDFDTARPEQWRWTLMLRMPGYVTPEIVARFANELTTKKKDDIFKQVRLETYHEGPSVQLMHIGSYDTEGPNIQKMLRHAAEQGYRLRGKHHELYYGDPRRGAPEKLRTVLRHPVANSGMIEPLRRLE